MRGNKHNLLVNTLVFLAAIILFLIVSEAIFRIVTYQPKGSWFREHTLEEYRERWTGYFNNSYEYNHLMNYSLNKPKNIFRIAAIGDSFTQGGSTENGIMVAKQSFPLQLEILLNQNFDDYIYEVMNFGFSSSTTLEERFILEEYVLRYDPDLIILGVPTNDRLFGIYNLDPFKYCGIKASNYEKRLYFLNEHFKLLSYLFTKLPEGYNDYYLDSINNNSIGTKCFEKSLKDINIILNNEQIPWFVVFFNDIIFSAQSSDSMSHFINFETIDKFNASFRKSGVGHVLWSYPYFYNVSLKAVLADDLYHYNSKGNELIAKVTYNYLLENKLIPSYELQDCSPKLLQMELGVNESIISP